MYYINIDAYKPILYTMYMKYYFPTLYVQPICVLDLKQVSGW